MGPCECRSGQTRKSTTHRWSSRNRCAPPCSDISAECPKLERRRPLNRGTCVGGENTDCVEQSPSKACEHLKLQAVNVSNRVGFARSSKPDVDHILGWTQVVRLGRSEADSEQVDGHDVSDVTPEIAIFNLPDGTEWFSEKSQILFNATTTCNSALKSTYSSIFPCRPKPVQYGRA